MKIEICEQLVASWLKHVKGCQIVQTNWSPSRASVEITDDDIDKMSTFINAVKETVSDDNLDIFKKSKPKQFVFQCEIDVAGVKITGSSIEKLYLIDSAFHENGLGYKNPVETVLKKILRALIVAGAVFKNLPFEVVFVTPICANNIKSGIISGLTKLKEVIKAFYPAGSVTLLFNEDFTSKIYSNLIPLIDVVSDDNDLFLRSMQLAQTAESVADKKSTVQDYGIFSAPLSVKSKRGKNKDVVLAIFNDLNNRGVLKGQILSDLCNPTWVNRHFGISTFPVLISVDDFKNSGLKDCRFYKNTPFEIDGIDYLICNEWKDDSLKMFEAWYISL